MKILHIFTISATAESFFDGQLKFLSEKGGHNLCLISSSDKNEEFCQRNHVSYNQLDIARRIDIKADLITIKNLISFIKKEKFDFVVGHTPKGAMVAMIASKLSGVKNRIYYRHGLIYTTAKGIKRFILKSVEQFTAFCASKVVNVSPSLSELAIKDHLNSDKKQIVIGKGTCGGIDAINTFNPELVPLEDLSKLRSKLGLKETDFIIGFVGRICKEKGIRELIDGFKIFKDSHPDIYPKLMIVGDFDARDILPDDYKKIIEADPDIITTGFLPRETLSSYYALMDVLVLPSYREGFGMCVIEAGAMEVPALVSRSHGCIDSIVENETGKYIDISPEGISKGLESLLNDEERISLGKKARFHVLQNYDHSVLWPKILDFYSSQIQNNSL